MGEVAWLRAQRPHPDSLATGAGRAGGAGEGGSVCPSVVPRSALRGSGSTSAAATSRGLTTPSSTAPRAPRRLAAAIRALESGAMVGPATPVVAQAAAPTSRAAAAPTARAAAAPGAGATAGGDWGALRGTLWGAFRGGALGGTLGRGLALLLVLLAGHLGGRSGGLDTFKEKRSAHKLQATVSPVSGLTRAYAPNPSCLLSCDVQEKNRNGSQVQLTWQDSSLILYSQNHAVIL